MTNGTARPTNSARTSYATTTSKKTTASSQSGPKDQIFAVEWERDILDKLAVIGCVTLLLIWIAAAVAIWRLDVYVPLDFFDKFAFSVNVKQFGTANLSLGNGNYNTLVQVVASFLSAGVAYGIGVGFKAILRRRLLRGPQGISLYSYQALVQYASLKPQLKFRWSAIAAAFYFGTFAMLSPATAAAFGSSIAMTTVPAMLRMARLTDNLDYMANNLGLVLEAGSLPQEGEFTDYLDTSMVLAENPTDTGGLVFVMQVSQYIDRPLFSALGISEMLSNVVESGGIWPDAVTARDRRLLTASSNTTASTIVEAFTTNATCSQASYPYTTSTVGSLIQYDIQFPCSDATILYDPQSLNLATTHGYLADAFSCQHNTENVYFYTVQPATRTMGEIIQCSYAASSSLYTGYVRRVPQLAWVDVSSAQSTISIPSDLDIGTFLSIDLLNSHGLGGWHTLMLRWSAVQQLQSTQAELQFFETYLQILVSSILAKSTAVLSSYVETGNPIPNVTIAYSNTTGEIETQALRIHLAGGQLAWLLIPCLLLLLLMFTGCFVFVGNTGKTDFTDPTSTALIGINSKPSQAVLGSSTGSFYDPFVRMDTKKQRADLHRIHLAFGERDGMPSDRAGRLEFLAFRGENPNFSRKSPVDGREYV